MTALLESLNALSPLAVIALGLVVIYTLVRQHKTLTGNHLHEIPHIVRKLEKIAESGHRQEVKLERIHGVLEDIRDARRRE